MTGRLWAIAYNTYREAVRDRVLYNLILFALLIVGASVLFGQISLDINRIVLINLGLTAISLFGIIIAIFIGIGLVSKEIEKRTLYTVLAARPVRRWEFIAGKFLGLVMTLTRRPATGNRNLLYFAGVRADHGTGPAVLDVFDADFLIYFCVLDFCRGHIRRGSAGVCRNGARRDPRSADRGCVPGSELCGAQRDQPSGARCEGGTEADHAEHAIRAGIHGERADSIRVDF
jgi:hypothetical protein